MSLPDDHRLAAELATRAGAVLLEIRARLTAEARLSADLTRMRAEMVSVSSVTKPAAGRASSADSPKLERAVWSGWPQSVTAAVKRWRK